MDLISEAVASTRAGRAVACRNRYAGTWSTRFPAVNGSGLHIVRHGSLWFIPEHGPASRLHAGDVVFVPRGPQHGFSHAATAFQELSRVADRTPNLDSFDVEFVSCCYHLDRGQIHESFNDLPDVLTLTIDDQAHPMLRTLADLLGEHAAADRPGNDIALPALVDLLLIHLLRGWHGQNGENWPESADPQIAGVLRTVQEEPHKPWTVRQLCDLAGLSRATFARRFTDMMGETPSAYLIRRRLDHGAQLLRYTELPLASIASQLGYSTEFSFSSAFRRGFGIAPGRFRLRERDPNPSGR
jgi:AraC-like DNA-binding protein